MVRTLSVVCTLMLLAPVILLADAGAAAAATDWQTFAANAITLATPAVVPLVVTAVRRILPKVPRPLIPVLAVLLGVAADYGNALATGHGQGVLVGAALGAIGVVIRDTHDQLQKRKAARETVEGFMRGRPRARH